MGEDDDRSEDLAALEARIKWLNDQAAEQESQNKKRHELRQLQREAEARLERAEIEAQRLTHANGGLIEARVTDDQSETASTSRWSIPLSVEDHPASLRPLTLQNDDSSIDCALQLFDISPHRAIGCRAWLSGSSVDSKDETVHELAAVLTDERQSPPARAKAAGKLATAIAYAEDDYAWNVLREAGGMPALTKLLWFTAMPPKAYTSVLRALCVVAWRDESNRLELLESGILTPLLNIARPFSDASRLQMALWKLLASSPTKVGKRAYVKALTRDSPRDEVVTPIIKLVKDSTVAGDQCLACEALAALAACSTPQQRLALVKTHSVSKHVCKILTRRLVGANDPVYTDDTNAAARAKQAAVTTLLTLLEETQPLPATGVFSLPGAVELLQAFAASGDDPERRNRADPARAAIARVLCNYLLDYAREEGVRGCAAVAQRVIDSLLMAPLETGPAGWLVREQAARIVYFLSLDATGAEAANFVELRMRYNTFFFDVRQTQVDSARAAAMPSSTVDALMALVDAREEGAHVDRARVAAVWALVTLAAGTKQTRRDLGPHLPRLLVHLERTRRTEFKQSIEEADLPEAILIALFCLASKEKDLRSNFRVDNLRLIVHAVTISCSTYADEAATRLLDLLARDSPAQRDIMKNDTALCKQVARNALDGDTPDLRQASKDLEATIKPRSGLSTPTTQGRLLGSIANRLAPRRTRTS